MKKNIFNSILFLFVFSIFPLTVNAGFLKDNGVVLKLNNSYILYSDQEMPYINEDGRTMIPLSIVRDLMGCKVTWDPLKKKAFINFNGIEAQVSINSEKSLVNGEPYELAAPAILRNNSTMVPIGLIAKIIDIPIDWDAKYRVITLKSDKFLKNYSLENIDQMQNLNIYFQGKIVPQTVRFVEMKDPEQNQIQVQILNIADQTIGAELLHKNCIYYISNKEAGGDISLGFSSPRGTSVGDRRGYNPVSISHSSTFMDSSSVNPGKMADGKFVFNEKQVKYVICNYFVITGY